MLGIRDHRFQRLRHQAGRFLGHKVENHERLADVLAANHVDHQSRLARSDSQVAAHCLCFHRYAFAGAGAATGLASALRSPEWPWNVRVGENSPSLWPTMFSEMNTG